MLTLSQTRAYMKRLGTEMNSPTKEFLFEIHKAHVEKIPWQTVDLFAGKPIPIDFENSVNHILNNGSGYCFHLNGAFSLLLKSLGYSVSLHRAGVQSYGDEPKINSYHLGLTVNMLDEDLKKHRWVVDVGLGDMPFEPVPLLPGEYHQSPYIYKICNSKAVKDGWRLEHDPQGAFVGVDFDPEVVEDIEVFKPNHEFLSTSPDSKWINLLLVRNRHREGSNELRGCIFSQRNDKGIQKNEIINRSLWFDLLGEVFGEKLDHFSKHEKDELWTKAIRIHEDWKRSLEKRV